MGESILAPISDAAHTEGNTEWFGAIELDVRDGSMVWCFDAIDQGLSPGRFYENGTSVMHKGFRPASVERIENGLTMIAGWSRVVWVDEDGDIVRTETHKSFNDIHEVQKTEDGTYLVANTGADKIQEFDEDWNLVWQWKAWDYFNPDKFLTGDYSYYADDVDGKDIRNYALDPYDRFHVNYVAEVAHNILLCSALNVGVFLIDTSDGNPNIISPESEEYHNPCVDGHSYVACQSETGKVVRIVESEPYNEIHTLFSDGLSYVKDADYIGNNEWLITDTRNNRMLIWNEDEDEPKEEFKLGPHAKPYESDYLTGGDSNA